MTVKRTLLGLSAFVALSLAAPAYAAPGFTATSTNALMTTTAFTGEIGADVHLAKSYGSRSSGSRSFGGSTRSTKPSFGGSTSKPKPAAPKATPTKPKVTPATPATPRVTTPNAGGTRAATTPNTVRPTTVRPTTNRLDAAKGRAQSTIGTNRPRAVGQSTRSTVRGGYGNVSHNRYMIGGSPYVGFYNPGFGYIFHNPFFWYWMLSSNDRPAYAQQNNISESQAISYLEGKGYDVAKVQAGDEAYLTQLAEREEISAGEDAIPEGADGAALSLYQQAQDQGRVYGKFCGGSTGGAYYAYGRHLKDQLPDMVIELGSKAGSVSILTGIDAGECQIGISQNDVLFGERNTIGISALPIKQVLTENAHLLCKSGISSIQELRRSGKMLAIDKPGSGTNYTWNQMVDLDGNYASIPTLPMGGVDAMQAIQRGEAACVLSVVAPGAQSVNALADMARTLGYKLELASFDDGDFDNAKLVIDGVQKRVYVSSETDDEIYAGLDHAWGDPNTIEVGATVVVNKDWWNSLNELQKQTVLSAVSAAVPHLRAELRNR